MNLFQMVNPNLTKWLILFSLSTRVWLDAKGTNLKTEEQKTGSLNTYM